MLLSVGAVVASPTVEIVPVYAGGPITQTAVQMTWGQYWADQYQVILLSFAVSCLVTLIYLNLCRCRN